MIVVLVLIVLAAIVVLEMVLIVVVLVDLNQDSPVSHGVVTVVVGVVVAII